MEASGLTHPQRLPALAGFAPHLRLQSDERLVALVRRGHHGAFEALVRRYQPRLLAFCRHMLGSKEDAEDVVQESLVSAYRAIRADERAIRLRPWLYRIVRNRCLNHLGRERAAVPDAEAILEAEATPTAAETVDRREELRAVIADVGDLPETQRTALVLRQIDSLPYEQIAAAMETTVPSVKSLLVRARVSLAEGAEARRLTCAEVRLELGQAAEGIGRLSPPARRHARHCPRCRAFKRDLRTTGAALGALSPLGALAGLKQTLAAQLGAGTTAAAGGGAAGAGGGAAALGAGTGSVAAKAAAGLLAAGAVAVGTAHDNRVPSLPPAAGGAAVAEAGAAATAPPDAVHHRPAGESGKEAGASHGSATGPRAHRRHEQRGTARRTGDAREPAGRTDAGRRGDTARGSAAAAGPAGGEELERSGEHSAAGPAHPSAPSGSEAGPATPSGHATDAQPQPQDQPGGASGHEPAPGWPEADAHEETGKHSEAENRATAPDPKGATR